MVQLFSALTSNRRYLAICVAAIACAVLFVVLFDQGSLPGIGDLPLLGLTIAAALLGFPLLLFLRARAVAGSMTEPCSQGQLLGLFTLGTALAVPPIAIDLLVPFPQNINAPLPEAFAFYPAIALVAEVVFHLAPLAVLAAVIPRAASSLWIFLPVVFVEPVFQVIYAADPGLQTWLVFANVSLVSAAQLWLFQRYGFGAMIALRLIFYLFWHVIWGTARLALLF